MNKPKYFYILIFFVIFIMFFTLFVSYKLYNRVKFTNIRVSNLETLNPQYQIDKKFNKLEIEKIYLIELSKIRINNYNFDFKKLQLDQDEMYPTGYIDLYEDKLIFVSGNGNFSYQSLDNVYDHKNEDKLKLKNINSNLIDLSGVNILNTYGGNGFFTSMFIRDTFVDGDELFVVCNIYTKEENEVFVRPTILKSKIDLLNDNLDFEFFFTTNEKILYFTLNDNNEIENMDENIDWRHSGGRIQKYINNKYIYAVPDYNLKSRVEDQKSIYGKILLIDKNNKFEVLSYGHRNQQGLLYDLDKDIILSTEHGPSGGDEVNLIKRGKGYGWPKISKGKDPQVVSKDHSGNNYEEPIYFWETNPGISQIIKIPENKNINNNKRAFDSGSYLIASLMGSEEWAGRSLWNFTISKENKINNMNQIFVNDRIRDLFYDKKNEKILLVLENQVSLGIIDTVQKNLLHNSF